MDTEEANSVEEMPRRAMGNINRQSDALLQPNSTSLKQNEESTAISHGA